MDVEFNLVDFERETRRLSGALDQIPFALSVALNKAADDARAVLIQDTWPTHVTRRNTGFLKWALKTVWSTKRDLRVEVYDQSPDQRAHLSLHAFGGTKTARTRLAIPPKGSVDRTPHGVRKSQTPKAVIASTPKRALRITPRGIFVGVGGRLVLKYLFRRSVEQPADVPFQEAFEDAMRQGVRTSFPAAMAKAMGSRR